MRMLCLWVSLSVGIPCVPHRVAAQESQPVERAAIQHESPAQPAGIVTRGDLIKLGVFAGLTTLAYQADGGMRDAVRGGSEQQNGVARALSDVGNPYGGFGALALGGAMWGGGLIADNETFAVVGLRAVEAITVSGIITKVIKGAAGRARPRVAPHRRGDFKFGRGFSGGTGDGDHESFPSGHATAAFAFAAAVSSEVARRAPEHARAVTVATYGMGLVVGYARMHEDAHWFSDVAAGAGIGVLSGIAVTRWHAERPGNAIDKVLLRPLIASGPDGSARIGLQLLVQ